MIAEPTTHARAPQSSRANSGFTLIELTAAVAVLAVLCAGLATSIVAGMKMNAVAHDRDVAREAAEGQIERVLVTPFDQLVALDGNLFDVVELNPVTQGTPCGSIAVNATDPVLPRVTVRVDWIALDGTQSFELSVVIAEGL